MTAENTQEPAPLTLSVITVSGMDNNCYLLCAGDQALLIDAADDAPTLFSQAMSKGVRITDVVTTHRHWDHVRALEQVLDSTGARHHASYLDSPALPAPVDNELQDGDILEFAGHKLPVRVLRGHTPGGLAIEATINGDKHLFVGDSLFPGGLGKTESEGDFIRLYKDVTSKIFDCYPDETIIHPGHGADTTLGAERPHLQQWWDRRW